MAVKLKRRAAPRASKRAARHTELVADVAIIGGGVVGLTLAATLGHSRLSCVVIDREDPKRALVPERDGRTMAIAQGPKRMLEAVGAWSALEEEMQPIFDIRVSDGDSRMFLHYDHREVGGEPMGYIIDHNFLKLGLRAFAGSLKGVDLLAPAAYTRIERTEGAAVIDLADGRRVRAALLIGADGRGSGVRRSADIDILSWRYGQTAIVCTIEHERPHQGIAHEHFLPPGPFAVLPMVGNRSSIVWTEREGRVKDILALSEDDFIEQVARRIGGFLGEISLVGKRFAYPLTWQHARSYVAPRLALAGDAAHGMHPIAGQGLNMGLRDVAALAEVLTEAHRLGLDIGALDVLERYQRWRRPDNLTMLLVTDVLDRLFSNNIAPLRIARTLGLAAVHRLPPLKRLFMHDAMGTLGTLPRLLRGEEL
jgi:2-octaprenyl-6-methoxyphenol hydroxylase